MSTPGRNRRSRPLVLLVDPSPLRRTHDDLQLRTRGFLVLAAASHAAAESRLALLAPQVVVAHRTALIPASESRPFPNPGPVVPAIPLVVYGPANGAADLPETIDEIVGAIRQALEA